MFYILLCLAQNCANCTFRLNDLNYFLGKQRFANKTRTAITGNYKVSVPALGWSEDPGLA